MDDLKQRVRADLERLSPSPDGLEKTLQLVRRRQRYRRVSAAALGLALTSGLVVGMWAIRSLGPATRHVSSGQATDLGTVTDVAFGDGSAWALTCDRGCSGDQRNSSGYALQIDPATGSVLASVPLKNPSKIAAGEGAVWVTSFWEGTVTRIDPISTTVVQTISLELPSPVCDSCSGATDFLPSDIAVGEGAVWVDTGRGALARIDPATNDVTTTIQLPGDTTGGLAVDGGAVWVTENVLGLCRIDPATNEVTSKITVDDDQGRRLAIDEVAAGSDAIYVMGTWATPTSPDSRGHVDYQAGPGAGVAQIDPASGQVVSTVFVGQEPRLMAFDGGTLWLWEFGGTTLEGIDPDTGNSTAALDASASGHFVAVGDGAAWVAMDDGTLTRMDLPAA